LKGTSLLSHRARYTLSLYVRGWRTIDPGATPYVRVELRGCGGSGCETLLSEVVVLWEGAGPDLVYKGDFKLGRSIFGYEYINFTVAPHGPAVAVHELSAFTSARCVFNYSLAQPAIRVVGVEPRFYHLSYPGGIDYSGLVKGLASSLAGLLLVVVGVYVKLYDLGKRLKQGAGR